MPRLPPFQPAAPPQVDLVIRRLSHFADLSAEERALLHSLAADRREVPIGFGLVA